MVWFTNNNDENKQKVFTNSTSIERTCKTDPEDNTYLLCKIRETKLKNVNGENKYITEERDERIARNKNNMLSGSPFFSHPDLENLGEEGKELVKRMNDFTFMPFFGFLDNLFSSPFPKFYEREFDSYFENHENPERRDDDRAFKREGQGKGPSKNWSNSSYNFPKKQPGTGDGNVYDA